MRNLILQVLLDGRGGAYTTTLKQYQAKADYFACACLQKNDGFNINKTPGKFKLRSRFNLLGLGLGLGFLIGFFMI